MNLHHLSASSAKLFLACEAQWKSRYADRASSKGGTAASQGTAIHQALENYFKGGLHEIDIDPKQKLAALLRLYDLAFDELFPHDDHSLYGLREEGKQLLAVWLARNPSFDGVTTRVIEGESEFMLETKFGLIPCLYRMDRVDERQADARVTAVDYKSGRYQETVEELRNNIQVRVYAVAIWKQFPGRDRYSVVFDYLRGKGPIGVTFTVEEIEKIYAELVKLAERIVESDGSQETVNVGCRWCHRKLQCGAFARHAVGVGIHSLSLPELVDRRVDLTHTLRAVEQALVEIDEELAAELKKDDAPLILKGTGPEGLAHKSSSRRAVDVKRVLEVMSPAEIVESGGKVEIGVGALEALIGSEPDPERRRRLKDAIQLTQSRPSMMVVRTEPEDG